VRTLWTRLGLNQRLAALAIALGAVALAAQPMRGTTVTIDTRELAIIVQGEVDHVAPLELADWAMAGRADYRLIDLRSAGEYAQYHVPGAEHVPLPQLLDASLARPETIVLYSEGGIHAAQAWFLLRAHGYRGVYILRGGLDGWKDDVLFPTLGEGTTPFQQRRNARLAAIAAHFGGQAQAPGTGGAASLARPLPSVAAPPPVAAGAAAPKKKKKEGC
jgi:rhodanese-related sulfurtransferase